MEGQKLQAELQRGKHGQIVTGELVGSRGGAGGGFERERARGGKCGGHSSTSADHEISNLVTKLGKRQERWESENAMYAQVQHCTTL